MSQSKPVDLVIAGVQKAATSSLKNYMGQHPQILTHGEKEFTFFLRDEEYKNGYNKAFHDYFQNPDLSKKILIKNVGIIFWEEAIQRLHQHNPNAKIILVLRNPVSRAYSAFWFAKMRGDEKEEAFENALHLRSEISNDRINSGMTAYLERGNYLNQLKTLYKYFKSDQVKIILLEDLNVNPENVLYELFEFCEMDSSFKPILNNKFNQATRSKHALVDRFQNRKKKINPAIKNLLPGKVRLWMRMKLKKVNRQEFVPPPMNPETKVKLIEYYKPMVNELSLLLGRDLSHWNK